LIHLCSINSSWRAEASQNVKLPALPQQTP
jgi:hypothetical protein